VIVVALPTDVTGPVKFASVVTVAALPVTLPLIGFVTVKFPSVPTDVNEELTTLLASVVPVSVPAAAVTVMFEAPVKVTPLIWAPGESADAVAALPLVFDVIEAGRSVAAIERNAGALPPAKFAKN
jgi:hypothetical protein